MSIVSMRYFVLYFSCCSAEEDEDEPLDSIASRLPAAAMFGFVEISAEADAVADAEEEEEEAKAAPGEASSGLLLGVVGIALFAAGLGNWRA